MVQENQKAPGFTLPDKQSGDNLGLDELTTNQHVLLVFLRHLG
jgi:peroxiredoxin